ncbi:MAG: site-specific integrase [Zoogloea sp.]|uniref:tyrosine-type recombinase/integrase n=1 Tax=Zoogloea sp. TaxID=49181 RepID=UPI002636BB70|nr:site-specific integrase [Zoogloea sp.]MDD2991809.1 site-specific integrase [Zoogloea sp.]
MASISQRGNSWRVRIIRRGDLPITKTFSSEEAARVWAQGVEADLARGLYKRPIGDRTTFAEVLRRYSDSVTPTKRGKSSEGYRIKTMLAAGSHAKALTCKFLSDLSSADVAAWRDRRLRESAPATVLREMAIMSNAINVAVVDWGYSGLTNPFEQVRKPRVRDHRDRRVSAAEIDAILGATESRELSLLVRLALECAARRGELLALKWRNIDLAARTARLDGMDTKNGFGRTVPLSPAAVELLRALPRRLDGGEVFTMRGDSVTQAFSRAVQRARGTYERTCAAEGVAADPAHLGDIRFHDLRHESLSRWAEAGLSSLELAAVSGHRTLQLLSRYVHLKPEALAQKLAASA